jgi:hypothetical protein
VDGKLEPGIVSTVGSEWMADREDDLSKRKDLRNGKESGRWNPGRWSLDRALLCVRHVRREALIAVMVDTPPSGSMTAHAGVHNDTLVAISKLRILKEYGATRFLELYPNG